MIGKIQIDASISGVRAERRGRPMGFVSEDLIVSTDDLAGKEGVDGGLTFLREPRGGPIYNKNRAVKQRKGQL